MNEPRSPEPDPRRTTRSPAGIPASPTSTDQSARLRRAVTRIELERLESESIAPSAELRARLRKLTRPEP